MCAASGNRPDFFDDIVVGPYFDTKGLGGIGLHLAQPLDHLAQIIGHHSLGLARLSSCAACVTRRSVWTVIWQ